MSLKALYFLLIILTSFVTSSTASDFEWRHALNLQAHSDPYRYRYGLMQRFGTDESHVIAILSRVYEPSDAYMVFRLAELSGYSSEEVLRVYNERRHLGWNEIASVLGIHLDRHEFLLFRERHDMREVYYKEHYRPSVHYHYVPQPKHYVAPQRHPHPKPQRYEHPRHERAPVVQERPKAQRHHAQPYAPQKYEAHYQKPPHPHPGHRGDDKKHYQR
jgi:hypothetical protein